VSDYPGFRTVKVLGIGQATVSRDANGSEFGLAHDIELIKPIRPIKLVFIIANVNTRPTIADEISGLEDGSRGSLSGKFRMGAIIWMFAVDRK